MAATLAELTAEPWWGREIVTLELDWLGDELCRRTGRSALAFGAKGNLAHLRGGHRSQEWIKNSEYCTSRTYTVQSGLTAEQLRHIAAGDWTPGEWGTAANRALMVTITKRVLAAMRAGLLPGVTEVIGTLDGKTVHGERADGTTFSADDSHLDHLHLTFDRRRLRDAALMAKLADIITGDDVNLTDSVTLPLVEGNTQKTAAVGQILGYDSVRTKAVLDAAKRIEATATAILTAVSGDQDAEQIIAEIRAQATAERQAREQERPMLAADVVAALAPLIGQDGVTQEMLEAALRSVLGSLDATPAQ